MVEFWAVFYINRDMLKTIWMYLYVCEIHMCKSFSKIETKCMHYQLVLQSCELLYDMSWCRHPSVVTSSHASFTHSSSPLTVYGWTNRDSLLVPHTSVCIMVYSCENVDCIVCCVFYILNPTRSITVSLINIIARFIAVIVSLPICTQHKNTSI